jgi:hypothetical protein
LFDGGDTVTVLVLVLTEVLIDVLTLGSVVVVLVGSAVVSVLEPGGVVVSLAVWVGATAGADPDVVVAVVVELVVSVPFDESDVRLTASHTMSAISSAMSAPNPISAAGLRYHGTGGSGGWSGCPGWS